MPGNFSYTESTNIVTVTGGTSGSPATLADFVAADRAGTGTKLLDAGTPANNLTLTYQVRPVELRALNNIKFIVADKTAETDYIYLTGTDAWDAAQTESIDVSAGNGSYTSTKRWRTITNIDCSDNAAGGGTVWADGDLSVTQDIWGVIWDLGNDQYQVDARFIVGNGSASTYFAETGKQIVFNGITSSWGSHIEIKANATLVFGTLNDADKHDTKDGCSLHFGTNYNGYLRNNGGTCYIYSSHLFANVNYLYVANVNRFWNCVGHKGISILKIDDVYRVTSSDMTFGIREVKTGDIIEDVVFYDAYYGIRSPRAGVRNIRGYNLNGCLFLFDITNPDDCWAANCYTPGNFVNITSSNSTGNFYRQFTLEIEVQEEDGTAISGATVNLVDAGSNKVWDGLTTDANGNITANGEDNSPYDNAVSYKRYYYSGGMQTETYGPWTLTVAKAGFAERTIHIGADDAEWFEANQGGRLLVTMGTGGSGGGGAVIKRSGIGVM